MLSLLLLATACGFQLRGVYPLPFDSLYISLPEEAELRTLLKRAIVAGSSARVVDARQEAQATLLVLNDSQVKSILSISAAGQAQEYQLVRTFVFRVIDRSGADWVQQSPIVLRRDLTFNNNQVLAKESEEGLLWNDIQNDLVRQIMRRLAAARPPA